MTKLTCAAMLAAMVVGFGIAHADDQPTTPQTPPTDKGNEGLDQGNNQGSNGTDDRPWAKGVSKAEQDAALALFHEGNQFLNKGILPRAAEKYREALKHWDHPAINYNLALAVLPLNQPIEAYNALQKAIKYGDAPLDADKFKQANDYLALVQQQLADIEVSCDKPGADVSVDGKKVFTAPGKFTDKVKIGKHTFVCQKPGSITRIKAPYIGPNEKFRIELKLYTAEDLTRYHRKWKTTWFPYAVIGAGAAIALGGGAFELSARSSFNDFDKQVAACNMAAGNNAGCATNMTAIANLRSSGNTKQTIAYVGYGLGAGTAIVGGLLAYANRRQSYQIRAEDLQNEQDEGPAPAAPPTGVSFSPIVSPDMTGAAIMGHF